MKNITLITIAVFAVQLFILSPAIAEDTSGAQCSVQAEFYDPEIMANTMANPEKFKQLMTVICDPETTRIMMNCASNPEQWNIWMSKFSDPEKMKNTMMVFMNPGFYTAWMNAFMPWNFYKPM